MTGPTISLTDYFELADVGLLQGRDDGLRALFKAGALLRRSLHRQPNQPRMVGCCAVWLNHFVAGNPVRVRSAPHLPGRPART